MTEQRLFISHASEDDAVVGRIVAYLEARGVPCWISSRDIPPRAIYADAIVEGMQACSACAVIVSAASNASKAVKRELELASHEDKAFIPIRTDETEPTAGVAYYLRNAQWVDYRREGERALERVVSHMRGPQMSVDPPTPRRTVSMTPPLIAGALLLVAAGAWFAWTQQNRPPQDAALPIDLASSVLGSYHSEGVACGEGSTITREDRILVFARPGAPPYRHEVVSAARVADGHALRVETRVTAPAEHAGESFSLLVGNLSATKLSVTSNGRVEEWERCDQHVNEQISTVNSTLGSELINLFAIHSLRQGDRRFV